MNGGLGRTSVSGRAHDCSAGLQSGSGLAAAQPERCSLAAVEHCSESGPLRLSVGLWLSGTIRRRSVCPSGLFGGHYAAALKCRGLGSCRNGRLAVVHRSAQLRV